MAMAETERDDSTDDAASPSEEVRDDENNDDDDALRICMDLVRGLHPDLRPLARAVLDVGVRVKAASAALKRARVDRALAFREECDVAAKKLVLLAKTSLDDGGEYEQGKIEAAFEEYGKAVRRSGGGDVSCSHESKDLEDVLEDEYVRAVVELDEKAREVGEDRAPWEIRYFATPDLDGDTGKLTVTLPFDPSVAGSTNRDYTDICDVCGMVIPSGEARVRCFECSPDCGRAVSCRRCHSDARAIRANVLSKFQGTPREAALRELSSAAPHLTHLSARECDSLWATRSRAIQGYPATTRRMLPRLFEAYADRPCFGVPAVDGVVAVGSCPIPYRWFTYDRVWRTVALLAEQLLKILPPPPAKRAVPRPEIGILSSPGPIFFAIEMACVAAGRVSVSTDATWRIRDALDALSQAGVSTLILDAGVLRLMAREGTMLPPSDRRVVVIATEPFDAQPTRVLNESTLDGLRNVDLQLNVIFRDPSSWNNDADASSAMKAIENYAASRDDLPGDTHIFGIFSSGTSGSGGRKGVLTREGSFRRENGPGALVHPLVATLIYSPTWATGKGIVWGTVCGGGRVGFAVPRPSGSQVWPYLASVRPTWCVSLVPALVAELLEEHDRFVARELSREKGYADGRMSEARAHARAAEYLYSCLGGVVASISIGAAMVNQSHVNRLAQILPCEILQGYGSTEGGGLATTGHATDKLAALPSQQFRIESRPELGYTEEDLPHPRGELLILGELTATSEEWFGDEASVQDRRAQYTDDGYYCTGDIVEFNRDANTFRVVDRAGSLVKLPDGKFLSPNRVESAIGHLGEFGVTDHMVAVAPNGAVALILETSLTDGAGMDKPKIAKEVQRRCIKAGVDQRSMPRFIIVDSHTGLPAGRGRLWKSTGCYTVSGKLVRRRVLDRVASQLASLGSEMNVAAQPEGYETLLEDNVETTAAALLRSIGFASEHDDISTLAGTPLGALGVDSLLWARLRNEIRSLLARRGQLVDIPLFDAGENSMRDVFSWMIKVVGECEEPPEEAIEESHMSTLMPSVDPLSTGADSEQAGEANGSPQDLMLQLNSLDSLEADLFRRVEDIEDIIDTSDPPIMGPSERDLTCILLSGATGFLGRHVLQILLKRRKEIAQQSPKISQANIKVICLVRGTSLKAACQHLIHHLSKCASENLSCESFTNNRTAISNTVDGLQVVLADVSKSYFGLQRDAYDQIAAQVNSIIHCAAVVKMWSLDSRGGDAWDMVCTNLSSCVNIAHIAARSKVLRNGSPISVIYVSTKSVESGRLPEGQIVERIGEVSDTWMLHRHPYSTSKLLGETVLLHASQLLGFSLKIMRPSFLTFSMSGDANDRDYVVRLLLSVNKTCISPTRGSSEFLNRRISFQPVDEYAGKVVKEAFSLVDTAFGCRVTKWPDMIVEEETFSLNDVLTNIKGKPTMESVAPFAFRSAIIASDPPLPFLPLVDWLVNKDAVDEGAKSAISSFLSPKTSKTLPHASLPLSLQQGLSKFLQKRCSHLSLV